MANRKPLATSLDNNPAVRDALIKRITEASKYVPVAILLTVAQTLEEWKDQQ